MPILQLVSLNWPGMTKIYLLSHVSDHDHAKFTFCKILCKGDFILLLEHGFHARNMLIPVTDEYHNIIKVHFAVGDISQYHIKKVLECGKVISHTKCHDCVLKKVVRCNKCSYCCCPC